MICIPQEKPPMSTRNLSLNLSTAQAVDEITQICQIESVDSQNHAPVGRPFVPPLMAYGRVFGLCFQVQSVVHQQYLLWDN